MSRIDRNNHKVVSAANKADEIWDIVFNWGYSWYNHINRHSDIRGLYLRLCEVADTTIWYHGAEMGIRNVTDSFRYRVLTIYDIGYWKPVDKYMLCTLLCLDKRTFNTGNTCFLCLNDWVYLYSACLILPANTKHLHNNCTMSAQRLRRWSNIVQLLYKCFVFAGLCIIPVYTCNHCRIHFLIVSYQLPMLPIAGHNLCIIILVDTSCRWQVFV